MISNTSSRSRKPPKESKRMKSADGVSNKKGLELTSEINKLHTMLQFFKDCE